MNIAVCGLGRAGKELARKIILETEHRLIMGICRDGSLSEGKDVGELLGMPENGVLVYSLSECENALKDVDVVIDFSGKQTSMKLAPVCHKANKNLVICTTNFTDEEKKYLKDLSEDGSFGLVYAPNLTIGINLLMGFVEKLSRILPEFDFEIVERHRKDKPSVTTTAKLISKVINRGDTPISSVRAGGYVGIHEVTAASEEERITIEHESFSRQAFAKGALLAGEFVVSRKGFYEMKDVIEDLEKKVEK